MHSCVSYISKVLKKVVYNKIIDYVYPLISSKQYGFLGVSSCVLKLLSTISLIVDSTDSKHTMKGIFLDARKAFDSASLQVILSKLQLYGFTEDLLAWFKG